MDSLTDRQKGGGRKKGEGDKDRALGQRENKRMGKGSVVQKGDLKENTP